MKRNLLDGRKFGTRDWDEGHAIFLQIKHKQDSRNSRRLKDITPSRLELPPNKNHYIALKSRAIDNKMY